MIQKFGFLILNKGNKNYGFITTSGDFHYLTVRITNLQLLDSWINIL